MSDTLLSMASGGKLNRNRQDDPVYTVPNGVFTELIRRSNDVAGTQYTPGIVSCGKSTGLDSLTVRGTLKALLGLVTFPDFIVDRNTGCSRNRP